MTDHACRCGGDTEGHDVSEHTSSSPAGREPSPEQEVRFVLYCLACGREFAWGPPDTAEDWLTRLFPRSTCCNATTDAKPEPTVYKLRRLL